MGLFRKKAREEEDPDAAEAPQRGLSKKDERRLAKLRKKAAGSSRSAAKDARAARTSSPAPAPTSAPAGADAAQDDAEEEEAGLSKKEQRRLAKLRKKAQKGA